MRPEWILVGFSDERAISVGPKVVSSIWCVFTALECDMSLGRSIAVLGTLSTRWVLLCIRDRRSNVSSGSVLDANSISVESVLGEEHLEGQCSGSLTPFRQF